MSMADTTPAGSPAEMSQSVIPAALPMKNCWRCGKPASFDCAICPACEAPLAPPASRAVRVRQTQKNAGGPVAVMIWIVAVQLAIGVALGVSRRLAGPAPAADRLNLLLAAETINSVVVLSGVWVFARGRVPSRLPSPIHLSVWSWSWPLLALILAANVGYHRLLGSYLGLPPDRFVHLAPVHDRLLWIVALCVQPPLIEELCFRGLVLRALAPVMSVRLAVLIASAAFAVAHLGALMSMPYLFLVGFVLGIARTKSGGLTLPILLHAAHNSAVLWLHWHR
jgi:membrane protease YdiL (CAAX protease family)